MSVPLAIAIALAVLVAGTWIMRQRTRTALVARLRREWGQLRDRTRDMHAIAAVHAAAAAALPEQGLDDRTWIDLNMDDVFVVLDRTESVIGQQVLYARLRSAPLGRHLMVFDALADRFGADAAVRERAQVALSNVTDTAGYDLWQLTQDDAVPTAPWFVLFPLLGCAMLGIVAVIPFWPPAVLLVAAGSLVNLIVRGTIAQELRAVVGPFRQIGPLLATAAALRGLHAAETAPVTGPLVDDLPRLSALRRVASWAGRDATAAVSGDLGALVFEYLNLVFSLDANALYFASRELRTRAPELRRVIAAVGDVDAALSVASYRAGTPGWVRPAIGAPGDAVHLTGLRHPLLPDAVPNSVRLGPPYGVIITGSNMSGKSTFLRTLGVTAVLAQTIATCVAEAYAAPPLRVRSCIGRADDPATGRSYYLMEVDSVLELIQAAGTATPHLMLFDELFRGTNAVERIAAGEAVLATLVPLVSGVPVGPHIVVAATHDQELVDMLAGPYAPFHFSDRIDSEGLAFDYQIRPGAASTRNAIALLQSRGAPAPLVARALARAGALDAARRVTS